MTLPMLASTVFRPTMPASTTTLSATAPTSRVTLKVEVIPTGTGKCRRTVVLNPVACTSMVYVAGCNWGKMYTPSAPVLTCLATPVPSWVNVTSAPATTAPVGSVTVPVNPVVASCAATPKATNNARHTTPATEHAVDFIIPPPFLVR